MNLSRRFSEPTIRFFLFAAGLAAFVPSVFADDQRTGLSLFFQNSQARPIQLLGAASSKSLQELDIVATTQPVSTDQGIQPLVSASEFSTLDWTGVQMVEEDWRQGPDGTFQRQRFYRNARWMNRRSIFYLRAQNSNGHGVGETLTVNAGYDDIPGSGDGFVRRFIVRQIAQGCPAMNNCSGAQFTVQGLVQFRHNLEGDHFTIPASATKLGLVWSEQPNFTRLVDVTQVSPSSLPFGYGFEVKLDVAEAPANGHFFMPGDTAKFRLTLMDGKGRRLHPAGSLPTFGQWIRGEVQNGIRYFDPSVNATLYYALKHRESNEGLTIAGPVNRLKVSSQIVTLASFFDAGGVTFATTAADGYSAVTQAVPSALVQFNPAAWDAPMSDVVPVRIPSDALPGTYVAAAKFRRDFAGEALNRGTSITFQVGNSTTTEFRPKTGNCSNCHEDGSALDQVNHGIGDRRACYSCHATLSFEPDNALDIRVHTVHSRSRRFPGNVRNCSTCHLTTPTGPARGMLP